MREQNPAQVCVGSKAARTASKSGFRNTPESKLEFHDLSAKAWMPGTSSAKTRFALLPGPDERRAKPDFAALL
jgi:hypothetical protein